MAKKKLNQMIKKTNTNSQWFNNIVKSMGYTATDMVKDMFPNAYDIKEYSADPLMDMAQSIRKNVTGRKNVTSSLNTSPQYKIGKDFLENIIADAKSGNFNNKSREMSFDESDFGFDDTDFDFGGDIEWGEDESSSSGVTTVKQTNVQSTIDTLPLAKAISASAQTTVATMGAIQEQNVAIETEKMMMSHKNASSIMDGLSAMNDNLSALVSFHGDSTSKFYAASIKYYEDSLDKFEKMMANAGAGKNDDIANKAADSIMNSLYSSKGNIKLDKYAEVVKKNLEDIKDESVMITSAFNALSDMDTWKGLSKNPLGTLANLGLKAVIPATTKMMTEALDNSLSTILPSIMAKINSFEDSTNPMYDYIYRVFGSKNKLSYKVDLGDYNRGVIGFDGEAKKALTEVLPAHLSRIESALTGIGERTFDYATGTFIDVKDIKKNQDSKLKSVETAAYRDIISNLKDIVREMGASRNVMKQFEDDLGEFFSESTKRGSMINPFTRIENGTVVDELNEFGLFGGDSRRANLIRNAFKGLNQKDLVKATTSSLYTSRQDTQRYMDEIRSNPTGSLFAAINNNSVYDKNGKMIYNGTKAGTGSSQVDKYGLNQLDYLRDIRSTLVNGITVYQGNWKARNGFRPNDDLIKKERLEENRYKKELEKQRKLNQLSNKHDGDDSLSYSFMEGLDYDAIYGKTRQNSDTYKDNKISSKLGKRTGKFNNAVGKLTNFIDNEVQYMLFGSDMEEVIASRGKNKSYIQGLTQGGGLQSTIGFFTDTLKGVGAYFTGQSYIKSDGTLVKEDDNALFKKMGGFFNKSLNTLTGDSNSKDSLFKRVGGLIMDGAHDFKTTLFGVKLDENDKVMTMRELSEDVKKKLPKAIGAGLTGAVVKTALASKLGLLGSIILPGGPLGAALMGTTMGFLSQSDSFKNWLFGDKDKEGIRMGGFLPKSFTDMLSAHGQSIKTGAIAGGAVGLLPSFFLPGGPITGAMLGVGTAMMSKSDAFQEFLYGKDFKSSDSKSMMNGAFGKIFKNTIGKAAGEGTNPKLAAFLGTAGIGAGIAQGVGLLPSFLLPGGPIVGALFGLAGGIAASSDKFQQYLFGEKDIDGKRYGGLMTKFTNWFDTTVMSPFKIKLTEINDNVYEFVKGKMINPLVDAFEPLTFAFKYAVTDAVDGMKNTWHRLTDGIALSFNENVIKPFGESLEKFVVDPMKKLFNKSLSMVGKLLGTVVASPFKLIEALGNKADKYNARHALRDAREAKREEAGAYDESNWFMRQYKIFTTGRMSREEKEAAINKALPYRATRQQNKIDREAQLREEMANRRAKRDELTRQYEEDVKFGKDSDWKFASKRQKDAREEELKRKQIWFQEQQAVKANETVEKLTSIDDLIKKTPEYEKDKIDALHSIKGVLEKTLERIGGESSFKDKSKEIAEQLRSKGQSHADGLVSVPEDGYLAELHQGEMVVPKTQSNMLRRLMNGDSKSENVFDRMTDKLFGFGDNKGQSMMGKMFGGVMKGFGSMLGFDGDNALGLSDQQLAQYDAMKDMQRREYVSRKDVDYMTEQMRQRDIEKEERKFREDLLTAIRGDGKSGGSGEKKDSLFDKLQDLMGMLGGLGGGVGAALAAGAAAGNALNYFKESKRKAEEMNVSAEDIRDGYGDAGQFDGQYYVHNNTDEALAIRSTKLAANFTQSKKYKSMVNGAVSGLDNATKATSGFLNKTASKLPEKSPVYKGVLGTTTQAVSADDMVTYRQLDRIGKSKSVDFEKTVGSNNKNMLVRFIENVKIAIKAIGDSAKNKFPKLNGLADNLVAKLGPVLNSILKNADSVMKKYSSKISIWMTKAMGTTVPVAGQIAAGVILGYDVITGFGKGNAGNLFQIPSDMVDFTMKTISAAIQGVSNLSWFGCIWIVNEITSTMSDFSFLAEIARALYDLIAGNEADKNFKLDAKLPSGASAAEAIKSFGAKDPSVFFNKDGSLKSDKELAKLKNVEGISLGEMNEIRRLANNETTGSTFDKQGWADAKSQTFSQKVANNKWVKNTKGLFSKQSIRGHQGLNKDVELSAKDRWTHFKEGTKENVLNSWYKMIGSDKRYDAKEEYRKKQYDINGKKTNDPKKAVYTYEEARNAKYEKQVESANAKINKYAAKDDDNWFESKWKDTNRYFAAKKRDKAREKMGVTASEAHKTKVSEENKAFRQKSSLQTEMDQKKILEDSKKANAEYTKKNKTFSMALDKNYQKMQKTADQNAKVIGTSIDKLFTSNVKLLNKNGKAVQEGLKDGEKETTKGFKGITKSLRDTSRGISDKMEKNKKDGVKVADKETKSLFEKTKDMLGSIGGKIEDASKNMKGIEVAVPKSIVPEFTIPNPIKWVTDLMTGIFKHSKSRDDNAGTSGVTVNDAPAPRKAPEPRFITPTVTKQSTPAPANTTNNTTSNKFVFYNQNDSKWGKDKLIGGKTMGAAGCGPTSLAMALSQSTGKVISPVDVARMGKQYLPGYSQYKLFPEIAKKFNMGYEDTERIENVVKYLKDGKPVILSGRQRGEGVSPFTSSGHVVVANSIDGENIHIADPRGEGYSRSYKISEIAPYLNRGMVLNPTENTKNRIQNRETIKGIQPEFIGTVNPDLANADLPESMLNENMGGSGQIKLFEKVLGYAKAFEGKLKYNYGSKAIDNNKLEADCSGFTRHVFERAAGINIGAGSSAQKKFGTSVPFDQAQPADIVGFNGHVGIVWDTNKNMIDIGSGMGPKIRSYNDKYWRGRGPIVIRRVLPDPNQLVSNKIDNPNTALGVSEVNGLNLSHSGEGATGESSNGTATEAADPLGIFGKFGQIGQNLAASVFNGKWTDLNGTAASTGGDATTGAASWNGTKYDLSKYDMNGLSETKKNFVNSIIHPVLETYKTHNLLPSVTLAQAAHESGWGSSKLTQEAKNLFGIKAGSSWTGEKWTGKTGEHYNGKNVTITDSFRAYSSLADSVIDRANFLSGSRYSKMMSFNTPKEQLQAMKDGGYATDPNYVSKILGTANQFTMFDQPKPPVATGAVENSAGGEPGTGNAGSSGTSKNNYAYYSQMDSQWNTEGVGGSTVAKAGCGPTSYAMMLTTLSGQVINPLEMTKWAKKKGGWSANGMSWELPSMVENSFGAKFTDNSLKGAVSPTDSTLEKIKAQIKAGNPVVMSGNSPDRSTNHPFTPGGHIILGVGVDGNNNIIVNEPRGENYTKAYSDAAFKAGRGLKGAWAHDGKSTISVPSDITTGGAYSGNSSTTTTESGGTSASADPLGVFGKFSQIGQNLAASVFNGKWTDLNATPSSGGETTTATGSGNFPKYQLNDSQIKGIANILQHEQPGPEGMQAEASLLANLTDIKGDEYATTENLIKKATGGWFAKGKSRFSNPGSPSSTAIEAVQNVLINGRRTVPRYVNEHDMFGDLTSVTNNGSSISKTDRSAYKPFVTKIKNRYGASGTFHSFPNSKSDPFYYTSEQMRQKWGEHHYQPTGTSAGKGDGKTYMITPKTPKVSKPNNLDISNQTVSKLKKSLGSFTTSMSKPGSVSSTGNERLMYEALVCIIDELQSINSNTAETANNVKNIEIVSANESVSTSTSSAKNPSTNNNASRIKNDKNQDYSRARQIAGFLK